MKPKNIVVMLICLIQFACQPPEKPPDYSDEAELKEMENLAREVFNLKLGEIERTGSQYNFVGIKSKNILVSRRIDSRTYFVQDQRYGKLREAGVFEGSDQELISFGKDLFRKLNIPQSEIREALVLQENIQVARVDSSTGIIEPEEPQKGQQLARFTRQNEGLPVFSSNLSLGLTAKGEIGFMQLHWPKIPDVVLAEAHRLKYKLEHGWEPPEQKGAIPESAEAGIVHSAAPGFLMDIYAAIRVIYMSEEQVVGRKLTLYYDRHGNIVPIPREFDIPCPDVLEQRDR